MMMVAMFVYDSDKLRKKHCAYASYESCVGYFQSFPRVTESRQTFACIFLLKMLPRVIINKARNMNLLAFFFVLFKCKVRATSHKPDEIYGIIERLSPGTRKIELFGRPHNVQPNWYVAQAVCELMLRKLMANWLFYEIRIHSEFIVRYIV
jgi:hypothetical protein